MADAEGINVQLGELGTFAMRLAEDSDAFLTELNQDFADWPQLGQGRLKEAGYANVLNLHRLQEARRLMIDAGVGAAKLATGALTIASIYADSDADAAATMDDVNAVFTAVPDPTGDAQADPDGPSPRANNPDGLPDPTDTTPHLVPVDNSGQSEAERRVEENREQYGERQDYVADPRIAEAMEAAARAAAAEQEAELAAAYHDVNADPIPRSYPDGPNP